MRPSTLWRLVQLPALDLWMGLNPLRDSRTFLRQSFVKWIRSTSALNFSPKSVSSGSLEARSSQFNCKGRSSFLFQVSEPLMLAVEKREISLHSHILACLSLSSGSVFNAFQTQLMWRAKRKFMQRNGQLLARRASWPVRVFVVRSLYLRIAPSVVLVWWEDHLRDSVTRRIV